MNKSGSARLPMERKGLGSKGRRISLFTNHFNVRMANAASDYFYNYSVAIQYEDGHPAEGKGLGRKVIDTVHKIYHSELDDIPFAYDGEKTLFTIGPLPRNTAEFTVVVQDAVPTPRKGTHAASPDDNGSRDEKRQRLPSRSKILQVRLSFARKIPIQAIANALRGRDSEYCQEALRVLDIILRQRAARQGCLLVRQSFFHNDPNNFINLGGGVLACRGFHSSFRTAQSGLSLNIDASTTMIVRPGPVIDFLLENQSARDPYSLDWSKARRVLKNLRIKVTHTNMEYRITGLSVKSCKEQMFPLRQKGVKAGDGDTVVDVTVYDYYVKRKDIHLRYSGDLPCIDVGKGKRPTYFPIELCSLISLQRYTKALSTFQRSSLVEKSRQRPQEKMRVLSDALRMNNYSAEHLLRLSGVSISSQFTQLEGRVLPTPRVKAGKEEDCFVRNGRWNFNNKRLIQPTQIQKWAIANFSARCDMNYLIPNLIRVAQEKGMTMSEPFDVFYEDPQYRHESPVIRVEKMAETMQHKLPGAPEFILCVLPERKNSDLYGPWKRRNLADFGINTQCIAPGKINDQYLTNLLLKINAKLGGLNSLLDFEKNHSLPIVSEDPTLILGMDVSHGSPGVADVPSVAAVVGSREWPLISRYRASVRTQSPKVEMIESLFKKVDNTDEGIMREMLLDFYVSSQQRKPKNIIIFRDGVSESQFHQVLNIEFEQIIEACKFLDQDWSPKFVIVVAQKNHHTKFFQPNSQDNVPPGTIIDSKVCHPKYNDFYLCAHAGPIGTTRPTHYHVLHDEVGFSPDEMQDLVHSLSYVYQKSTNAVSMVAPVCYAHLAAAQLGQFIKLESPSETPSNQVGNVLQLPKLNPKVANSMFFC